MKGGLINLCVGQLAHAEKKVENSIFLRGPLYGENVCQNLFSTQSLKIFTAFHLIIFSTGPLTFSHPSASLLELDNSKLGSTQ